MSNSLKRILAQEDTIIFVGSGISRWSGLPSWESLIVELSDYLDDNGLDSALVRQEAASGDLLQAASYAFLKLTPPQVSKFIRSACRSGNATPSALHKAIMSLGPRCFITTNYDDLLEQAYREYCATPADLRIVLNNQPFEQADIVHAQARQFIFKPHGDASQVESIILTREQYRKLLPEGAFSVTLNTLKTLLQSRPVLFLGFGLRDPDFLHLRDLLANIYRGGMRDHYAIVSDPVPDQHDYWMRHYGIHLVGYATHADGRDHGQLLSLLEELGRPQVEKKPPAMLDIEDSAAILALARYASSCLTPDVADRFVIRVSRIGKKQVFGGGIDAYNYWPVDRILNEGPSRLILLGEPGAGKSFAIREAVNTVASALQDACIQGTVHSAMRIPIMLDLKLYNGDLEGMVSGKFPKGLSLDKLEAIFPVVLYLDGYNEIPRSFREDNSFDRQLDSFLETRPSLGVVIGSRVQDGLDRFEFPFFRLSEISRKDVERRLATEKSVVSVAYREDVISILQRPFYFRLLDRHVMSLDKVHSPADLYSQYISGKLNHFGRVFGGDVNLGAVLKKHAYDVLNKGLEAFSLTDLDAAISAAAPWLDRSLVDQMANWLALEEVIIPLKDHRASFVHQSITEYLAACELVDRIQQESINVSDLINLRRWDNGIFLALGMLDERFAKGLLMEIAARDINFAIRSARFVEYGREAVVGWLLEIIPGIPVEAFDFEARIAFEKLPFALSHEAALRQILLKTRMFQGEAYKALADVLGGAIKDELVDALFSEKMIFFRRDIGKALSAVIEVSDISLMVDKLSCCDELFVERGGDLADELVGGIALALEHFSEDEIRRETIERLDVLNAGAQGLVADLVCDICLDRKTVSGLLMILEVARMRLPKTLFSLYLILRFGSDLRATFVDALDDDLFKTILGYIDNGDRWSIDLLTVLAEEPDIRARIISEAEKSFGVRRHLLEYCATRNPDGLFSALSAWTAGGTKEDLALLKLIDFPDLDWTGRHELLIGVLERHDFELARLILGHSSPPKIKGLDAIDLGDITPWLNWLIELDNGANEFDEGAVQWVAMQLGILIARSSASDNKVQVLRILHLGTAIQKDTLASLVLPRMEGLSIRDFSPEVILFLKSTVTAGQGGDNFSPHVFAVVADEAFVRDELFPLAMHGETAHKAVLVIARQVGKRLGVRLPLPSRD